MSLFPLAQEARKNLAYLRNILSWCIHLLTRRNISRDLSREKEIRNDLVPSKVEQKRAGRASSKVASVLWYVLREARLTCNFTKQPQILTPSWFLVRLHSLELLKYRSILSSSFTRGKFLQLSVRQFHRLVRRKVPVAARFRSYIPDV